MTTVNDRNPQDDMVRPQNDRVVAGVAAALARRLGIGVGWVRVGFVVMSPFGGIGLIAYALGWLLIREEGRSESLLESWFGDAGNATAWIGAGLIGLSVLTFLGATNFIRGDIVFAAALFVAGLILYRGKLPTGGAKSNEPPGPPGPGAGPPTPPDTSPGEDPEVAPEPRELATTVTASQDTAPETTTTDTIEQPSAAPWGADGSFDEPSETLVVDEVPKPETPPSPLGRIVFALILLAMGGLAAIDLAGGADLSAHHYLATAVGLSGAGLVIGAFLGRARGLIALGIILVPALIVSSVVRVDLFGEWGDQFEQPTARVEAEAGYELSGGRLVLDLTRLDTNPGDEPIVVEAAVGIGDLQVFVPPGASVDVDANVGVGRLHINDRTRSRETAGFGLEGDLQSGSAPQFVLDLEVGIGNLETAVR